MSLAHRSRRVSARCYQYPMTVAARRPSDAGPRRMEGRRWVLQAAPLPAATPAILDEEQRAVVEHRTGPLLVLAGPGTGKTTTIVEAIAARIEADGEDPQRLLALTFGRRAAADVRDRLVRRLGGGVLPTVATFHSYAYGLLQQTASPDEYRDPPRLLSGAEEDVRIRELLLGAIADGTIDWPADLEGAIGTLGLANEIRAVLARAKDLGLDPAALARIGAESDRPAWVALGELARQEAAVMLLQNVYDYAELLHRAVIRARMPQVAARLTRTYQAIYVDEYQDTDRMQVALLSALVGPQTALVAVGDPDQAIYGFRGADVTGILRFREQFPLADGRPAPVVVLGNTRRFGRAIRAAASALMEGQDLNGLEPATVHAHRHPSCPVSEPGSIEVQLFDGESARSAHVAQQIRHAHLHGGLSWSQMAILVRGHAQIAGVQRALMQQGVPVVVAADEIPLRDEPAVAHLLMLCDLACDPSRITEQETADLLLGPLSDLDASDVRRLGRALREHARAEEPSMTPPPSEVLLRDVLRGEREVPHREDLSLIAGAIGRLREMLVVAHAQVQSGASAQDVLWTLWSGKGNRQLHAWPERLRRAALAGSRSASHDLDAVIALFDAVGRMQARYQGVVGIRNVLLALRQMQIPAEPIGERAIASDAVRILTAHRAKGLEWESIWIIGAEEGTWPDLRPRGSILEPDRLTTSGLGPGVHVGDLLAEERRLFYVAITRARRSAVIAALAGGGDAAEQPSRFIEDLRLPQASIRRMGGWPRYAASASGLVARLRAVVADPTATDTLRTAAVAHLARLAAERDEGGEFLVPAADPGTWWGVRPLTSGTRPVRPTDEPVRLSGSGLESLTTCPLQWYLQNEARAEVPRPPATKFGSVVHALADYVAKGEIPADLEAVDALVDRVWRDLRFEAAWQSDAERREARAALARFLRYHQRAERTLVETESELRAVIEVPTPRGSTEQVRLRGFLDRIEQDEAGRMVAIDLKNMRYPPADRDIPTHAQLGVYQLLLQEAGHEVGGAALVQLRVADGKDAPDPKVQVQPALDADRPTWVEIQLGRAAEALRQEEFGPRPNPGCRICAYRLVCPTQPQGQELAPGSPGGQS